MEKREKTRKRFLRGCFHSNELRERWTNGRKVSGNQLEIDRRKQASIN